MAVEETLGRRAAAAFAARLIRRSLRASFRRIVWIGEGPGHGLDRRRPLVLYANHHSFYDGYLLWWLTRHLGRPPLLWMNEWERTPLFGPLGALPFPPDNRRQRLATLRETARRLTERPEHIFLYFPEGALGPPDVGLASFPDDALARLGRVLPPAQWWPVAIRVTWWGEDRPTALLGGVPHDAPTGREREALEQAMARLAAARPGEGEVLMHGAPSAHERWDLARLAPLFRRWT